MSETVCLFLHAVRGALLSRVPRSSMKRLLMTHDEIQEALLETPFCGMLLPHLAHTCAGTVAGASSAFAVFIAGVEWPSVLAILLEGATVEGVEALSPISFHISSAACVRLHQHVMIRGFQYN
jgi:hypothetical protein